jgi:two-component system CheB/CheR fusion protein
MRSERTPVAEAVSPHRGMRGQHLEAGSPEIGLEFRNLLTYLSNARGFDFRGYKTPSLARRFRKRMDALGAQSFSSYQDYLQAHPNELAILFNTIFINVTGFLRDPVAWDAVRSVALPPIVAGKRPGDAVRVWSAGCATGEETYTLAIILAEELGPDEFRQRVKIYGTDVDEEALNTARHAAYTSRQVEGLGPSLLAKYFEYRDGLHLFRKELRPQLIFGRHDLINDPPISRIDLLTCRNTLMYLNAETQARVLGRLHFALNDGGFLLLGRAETFMAHDQTLHPVDLKRRLFRKGPTVDPTARDRPAGASHPLGTSGRKTWGFARRSGNGEKCE